VEFVLFTALSELQLSEEKDHITYSHGAGLQMGTSLFLRHIRFSFLGGLHLFRQQRCGRRELGLNCWFFAWLALHSKALTADNFIRKKYPPVPPPALCFCKT
jgi:hypothetical protein